MEIKQPHTRNVLRTGCAALENAEESLRSRSCKRLMARKLSFVHYRSFSAKAALVLPIPSFLEDRLCSTNRLCCALSAVITKLSTWPWQFFSIWQGQAVIDDKKISAHVVHSRLSSTRASAISKNWLDMKMRGQDAWRV